MDDGDRLALQVKPSKDFSLEKAAGVADGINNWRCHGEYYTALVQEGAEKTLGIAVYRVPRFLFLWHSYGISVDNLTEREFLAQYVNSGLKRIFKIAKRQWDNRSQEEKERLDREHDEVMHSIHELWLKNLEDKKERK